MKALVTGAAGFIGSHLSGALLDAGATVTGIDCFTDYYPRPLKEANLATLKGRPGFTLLEAALQDVDLKPLLCRSHPRLPSGRPGRSAEKLGTRFRRLYKEQRRGDSAPARSAGRDADPEICITRRARRSTATTCRCRCARTRTCSHCRPTACRSSPPSISGHLYWANYGVPGGLAAVFHRLRTASAAGYGISALPHGRAGTASRSPSTATASRRGTSRSSSDIVAANLAAAERGASGQRVQYWWWLPGHAEPRSRSDRPGDRQEGHRSTRAGSERRHAPHLRRYVGRPPRPRLRSAGQPRERPRPAISVAYYMKTSALCPLGLCPLLSAGACLRQPGVRIQPARDRRPGRSRQDPARPRERRAQRAHVDHARARISPNCSSRTRRARCARKPSLA